MLDRIGLDCNNVPVPWSRNYRLDAPVDAGRTCFIIPDLSFPLESLYFIGTKSDPMSSGIKRAKEIRILPGRNGLILQLQPGRTREFFLLRFMKSSRGISILPEKW